MHRRHVSGAKKGNHETRIRPGRPYRGNKEPRRWRERNASAARQGCPPLVTTRTAEQRAADTMARIRQNTHAISSAGTRLPLHTQRRWCAVDDCARHTEQYSLWWTCTACHWRQQALAGSTQQSHRFHGSVACSVTWEYCEADAPTRENTVEAERQAFIAVSSHEGTRNDPIQIE